MTLSIILSWVLFLALVTVLFSVVYSTLRNGISPMPSSYLAKAKIMKLLEDMPPDFSGVIYELGSGWGTLAFPLANKFPSCLVIAVENSPFPYLVSKLRGFIFPLKNLVMQKEDFFQVSLKDARVVVCYLYPGAMSQLKEKFEKELREDSWVISNTFAIPGWKPVKEITLTDCYRTKIYLYSVKTAYRLRS